MVTKNGRPAAILINVDEYARLKEALDVLSDPVLMKQIGRKARVIRLVAIGHRQSIYEDLIAKLPQRATPPTQ